MYLSLNFALSNWGFRKLDLCSLNSVFILKSGLHLQVNPNFKLKEIISPCFLLKLQLYSRNLFLKIPQLYSSKLQQNAEKHSELYLSVFTVREKFLFVSGQTVDAGTWFIHSKKIKTYVLLLGNKKNLRFSQTKKMRRLAVCVSPGLTFTFSVFAQDG